MEAFTRQQLYDLVWAKPMRDVAADLNISDVGLKKICAGADIPTPPRGYWAKQAAGKSVVKVVLGPRAPGMPEIVSNRGNRHWGWPTDPNAVLAEPEPVEPVFTEPLDEVEARVRKRIGKVAMIRGLDRVHSSIQKLLDNDKIRRERQQASAYPDSYWDAPLFDSPFEQRRLRVLNSIFLGTGRMGAKPWIQGKVARGLGIRVGASDVSFTLDHPKARKDRWGEEQVFGGKVDLLRLEIGRSDAKDSGDPVWTEEKGTAIGALLTDIVASLILAGEVQYRASAVHSYRYRVKAREEARKELERRRVEAERKERQRLEELERARRQHLLDRARDLRQANEIRALIIAVEEGAGDSGIVGFAEWSNWAHGVANRLDPLQDLAKTIGAASGIEALKGRDVGPHDSGAQAPRARPRSGDAHGEHEEA